ncbi:MarR family winged helix-turn-helix transcriptional regulator [Streptacidiphilus jiangxiensis]|uniref:DNA-binding transcriptional regulator, MarR family n=1 Tax=Streptacidiphilus jiangxiensis TaxID=235985 RepID=A0A1H7NSL5_STRJI|nr:MarR family transcriptional regulator [Streptacidiphilus jiangxiensis]SEL25977.1 DNA-binding transcriptional regulator, MarR family [Streptacidiphilus jiangxiensis]
MDTESQGQERPSDGADSVDMHLARWQGKAPFDARVEGIITRIQLLAKLVGRAKDRALAEVGLQEFEFATLHQLSAREAPDRATPSELAAELMLSPAGMTGRLDTLEQSGLVRRVRSSQDRRRVDVELTEAGRARWLAAMKLRGQAENSMVAPLDPAEQDTLNTLLKRMLIQAESDSRPR